MVGWFVIKAFNLFVDNLVVLNLSRLGLSVLWSFIHCGLIAFIQWQSVTLELEDKLLSPGVAGKKDLLLRPKFLENIS